MLPLHLVDLGLCLRNVWITKWNKWLHSKFSQPKNVVHSNGWQSHHIRTIITVAARIGIIYMNGRKEQEQNEGEWVSEKKRKILNRVNLSHGIHITHVYPFWRTRHAPSIPNRIAFYNLQKTKCSLHSIPFHSTKFNGTNSYAFHCIELVFTYISQM